MAAFKDEISPAFVAAIAADLGGACTAFDRERFERLATDGLDERELKARIALVADALVATMPDDLTIAGDAVRAAVAAGGLPGWASLTVAEYVTAAMLDRPDLALPLLAVLTRQSSAEFAIRPFIELHLDVTMAQLRVWVDDPDEHVRRLVSEGSRPRLPWAPVLRRFVADPTPTIELLDRLFDDESDYVRRSVANHLNDVSKDHPELAVAVAERWLARSTHGEYVARHSLRSLVKRGDAGALAVLGFGSSESITVTDLVCDPATVAIGGAVTISFDVESSADIRAAIDYRVHYQGANGLKAPKVFKLTVRDLLAGETVRVSRRHSFEHVSIRRIAPGPHRVDVQVNGRVLASVDVDVVG